MYVKHVRNSVRLWYCDKNIPHSGYEIETGISEQCSNVYTTLDYATDVKISNITALTCVLREKKMRWVDSSHHIKNLFSKNWDFFLSTTDEKKNQKWPYVSLSEGNCLWSFISERLLKIATAGEHRPDWVTNNISRHKSMVCNHHIPNRKGNWSLDALI